MTIYKCESCKKEINIIRLNTDEPEPRYYPCDCGETMHKTGR